MRIFLSFILIISLSFQATTIYANSSDNLMISIHIQGYNDIAKQYNEAATERTVWKKKVLKNLRVYINRVLSRTDRQDLKKMGYVLRTSPINGLIPLLNTGGLSQVSLNTSKSITPQVLKNANLSIKESSFQKISEGNDFKIYESEVTAVNGDITLERIDFVQFGTGEGLNIGELYMLDHGNTYFKLTTSKDQRIYSYYKRDVNPGISFDLFTGINPGIKIKKGEMVKFTIRIDTDSLSKFTAGKDFQRTNIFFAKYKIMDSSELVSGITPQIMVYDICDEGLTLNNSNTPLVFDTNLRRDLFKKTKITLYTKYASSDGRAPTEIEYKTWKNTLIDEEYSNDYQAYQSDVSEGFASGVTFDLWLKQKYIDRLITSYESGSISWVFYGHKSLITNQFAPPMGIACSQLETIAKIQKNDFKSTYDDIKKLQDQKNYTDTINVLNQKITELQNQVNVLQSARQQSTSVNTYYPDYSLQLQDAQEKARIYYNCLNGVWTKECESYGF